MSKWYPTDTRKKVLEMYRDGTPVNEIVTRNGISRGRVYEWVREANLPHRRKSHYSKKNLSTEAAYNATTLTLAERKALIDQFRISKNKTKFAKEHHIPRSTLYNWMKNDCLIQDYKGETIDMKMYYEALRSNNKLQQIIEVLHSVNCTVFAPLHVKLTALERLSGQYSDRVLCEALKVNRTTLFHHMNDNKRENTWYNLRRNKLKNIIVDIYNEHNQIPGVRKIRALMQEQGYAVSEKIVRELMIDLGISSIRNGAKDIYLQKVKEYNEINLKNICPGDRPDQVWVSDFTYFKYLGKLFSVCIIMDQCSRRVLAYKVGQNSTTQMLTYCFNNAMALRNPTPPLIFHSDQGCQYTSATFKNLLAKNGVLQSLSRRGTPTDNAIIESFNSSFKREILYRRDFQSVREFKEKISEYIIYYNTKRPHESLGYVTPVAYEEKFLMPECPNTSSNPDNQVCSDTPLKS